MESTQPVELEGEGKNRSGLPSTPDIVELEEKTELTDGAKPLPVEVLAPKQVITSQCDLAGSTHPAISIEPIVVSAGDHPLPESQQNHPVGNNALDGNLDQPEGEGEEIVVEITQQDVKRFDDILNYTSRRIDVLQLWSQYEFLFRNYLKGLQEDSLVDISQTIPALIKKEHLEAEDILQSDVKSLDDLFEQAERAADAFHSFFSVLTKSCDEIAVASFLGPMKTKEEARMKCEAEYGGDTSLLIDVLRASLVLSTMRDLASVLVCIRQIASEYDAEIVRVKNTLQYREKNDKISNSNRQSSRKNLRPRDEDESGSKTTNDADDDTVPGGYRDVKVNIKIKNHIVEVQLHIFSFWKIAQQAGYRTYLYTKPYHSARPPQDSNRGVARLSLVSNEFDLIDSLTPEQLEKLQYFIESKKSPCTDLQSSCAASSTSPSNLSVNLCLILAHCLQKRKFWRDAEEHYRFALTTYKSDSDDSISLPVQKAQYALALTLVKRTEQDWQALAGAAGSEEAPQASKKSLLDEAERLLQQVMESREHILGTGKGSNLSLLKCLANVLTSNNKFEEAQVCYDKAMSKAKNMYGPNHQEVLSLQNSLAMLLFKTAKGQQPTTRSAGPSDTGGPTSSGRTNGKLPASYLQQSAQQVEAAEKLLRETLQAQKLALGISHADTLHTLHNLALLLHRSSKSSDGECEAKLQEAEELCCQVLAEREVLLGERHTLTMESRSALASILYDEKKMVEAEALFRKTYQYYAQSLGLGDITTVRHLSGLASALYQIGQLEEAVEKYSTALECLLSLRGASDIEVLECRAQMALLLKDLGMTVEAEEQGRKALEGREALLGRDHLDTLTSAHNLAAFLYREHRLDEAEVYYRYAVSGRTLVFGAQHDETLTSKYNLAATLFKLEKYREAELMVSEVLLALRTKLGPSHPDCVMKAMMLALIKETIKDDIGAMTVLEDALSLLKDKVEGHGKRKDRLSSSEKSGEDSDGLEDGSEVPKQTLSAIRNQLLECCLRLVTIYKRNKLKEKEIDICMNFIREFENLPSAAKSQWRPRYIDIASRAVDLLLSGSKKVAAVILHKKVIHEMESAKGSQDPQVLGAFDRLAQLLEETGQESEAEGVYRQLLIRYESLNGDDKQIKDCILRISSRLQRLRTISASRLPPVAGIVVISALQSDSSDPKGAGSPRCPTPVGQLTLPLLNVSAPSPGLPLLSSRGVDDTGSGESKRSVSVVNLGEIPPTKVNLGIASTSSRSKSGLVVETERNSFTARAQCKTLSLSGGSPSNARHRMVEMPNKELSVNGKSGSFAAIGLKSSSQKERSRERQTMSEASKTSSYSSKRS